jgi:hypothetical protein
MEGVVNMKQDIKPQTTICQAHVCKEICKEGQQAVLDYFGNKAIVGTKGATTYSFKEPTMPQKAWRLSSLDLFPSSMLLLSDTSDTSCELVI